jgi:hypothetical protein
MLLTTLLLDVQGGSLPPVTNVTLPWLDYPCLVVDMSHHAIVCIETGYLPDHDHAHSKPLIWLLASITYFNTDCSSKSKKVIGTHHTFLSMTM